MEIEHDTGAGERGSNVRWGMGDAVAGNVLGLALSMVAVTVVVTLLGWDLEGDRPLWQVAMLQVPLWLALFGVPVWATRVKGRGSLGRDFGLAMRWTDVPLGVAAGVIGQFALGIAITVVYDVLGIDVERVGESAEALAASATDAVGVILLVLIVVIAAPFAEELFYRGLWLRAAQRRFGTAVAVVLTSVVFGVVHFQLHDLPALIGIALIFSVLTVVTGRLGPAIWAHVAFNATTVTSLLLS